MDPSVLIQNIKDYVIIDVRSPSEYLNGHIPFAINVPLFSDEERKIIGTIYKQEGKKQAIEKGLSFLNLVNFVKQFEPYHDRPIVVHCARGGMRSASVGWLLNLFDYKVNILKGGYKIFRRWVIDQFRKRYKLKVIGGYTGVGKTEIIKLLKNSVNLEALANHKGSAFGGFDGNQPTQEHFENLLAFTLFSCNADETILIEDESRFIGKIRIPCDFYNQMRTSSVIVLQDLIESRIKKCVCEYKNYSCEDLKNAVRKIEKKLGGVATKDAVFFIEQNEYEKTCAILFSYYDKSYNFSLNQRDSKSISYLDINNKTNQQVCGFLQNCL